MASVFVRLFVKNYFKLNNNNNLFFLFFIELVLDTMDLFVIFISL